MKKLISIILVIALVVGAIFFINYRSKTGPVDPKNPQDVSINIASGTSISKIGSILEENKLIKSAKVFKLEVKRRDLASKIQAGDYSFSTDMSLREVLNVFEAGPRDTTLSFNIPEGYELKLISKKLSEKGLIDQAKFDELVADKANFEDDFPFLKELDQGQNLEGFLFPATYEIYKNESEEAIIRRMLKAFEDVYNSELKNKLADSKFSLNEIVTLASIVEREAKLDKERPLMSAVFHNRLEDNINLGSCATVQYLIGERKPVLSNKDTRIDSPYNTYINPGLPPAPIASPGKAALVAAIEPADVDYLFFVLTGEDGSHTFTRTNAEHEEAKKKMIRE